MNDTTILAIETSCDETACAIVKNGSEILSNIVYSQIDFHKQYGGVIPESASRMHTENISRVISLALKEADIDYNALDAVAYTKGPGLIGALHVGVVAAKSFAYTIDKPLIAVNHIYGHIKSNEIENKPLQYPLLALIISGGHSELIYFKDELNYEVLGKTVDDAIGEAFDKVGRVMDIPYPGGVEIDKLSKFGEARYDLKMPVVDGKYNFSFSGLKTSVIQLIAREKKAGREIVNTDLAASFQVVAVTQLMLKLDAAINDLDVKQVIVAGGVSANSRVRSEINRLQELYPHIEFAYPPLKYCGDNAAMIAVAAHTMYQHHMFSDLDEGAEPGYRKLI